MSKKIDESKILELFFEDPREYHLREVARLTELSPVTAKKYLQHFESRGMLRSESLRGNTLFFPETRNNEFVWEKRFWNIRKIRKSGLLEFLDKELAYPTVVLFGSYAKGENHKESDIDLFLIAESKKGLSLAPFEARLGKSIQIFLHTPKEFRKLQETSPELLNNVLNGTILSGFVEVFPSRLRASLRKRRS